MASLGRTAGLHYYFFRDRIVVSNQIHRLEILRNAPTSIYYQDSGFRPSRILVGEQNYPVYGLRLSEEGLRRLEADGIQVIRSTSLQGMAYSALVLASLVFVGGVFFSGSDSPPLIALSLASALFFAMKSKKTKYEQWKVDSKLLYRRIFWNRRGLEVVGMSILMWTTGLLSDQPLSPIDRELRALRSAAVDGNFSEIKRRYEDLEPLRLNHGIYNNDFAWFLSVVPDVSLRDPAKAVKLAGSALVTHPSKTVRDTYVCALMANSDTVAALKYSEVFHLNDRLHEFAAGKLCADEHFAQRAVASEKR
jgi:hypothetical protein